jgi:pseudaminic acid cytidylyltransferase
LQITDMSSVAIIPARGGSKRIPHKNIKDFLGKPIIAYSIEAALKSGLFDEVMVSTDDAEIASVASSFGASVPFMRSAQTSNDYATTADVIREVLDCYLKSGKSFDLFCCLYSTAPFVTQNNLKEAFSKLEEFDSVFTVVRYSYPIQRSLNVRDGKVGMNHPQFKDSRSQDLEASYHDAGQFYFAKTDAFFKEKTLWGSNTGALILPELQVQDLDTETDWKLAEMKYKLLHNLT